jgi:hypothetical protein
LKAPPLSLSWGYTRNRWSSNRASIQAGGQQIHEELLRDILTDIRRKQAELPHQFFALDEKGENEDVD